MMSTVPLQRQIRYAVFPSLQASRVHHQQQTWEEFTTFLANPPQYPNKSACPLLKLAKFGDEATASGSLRSNSNMLEISGVEGDYDGGLVDLHTAAAMLETAGIECVLYTSPSHMPSAPRWRVLAPLSCAYPPAERRRFVHFLNEKLGGILAPESFTPSQAFYYGRISGTPYDFVQVRGELIDLLATPASAVPTPEPDTSMDWLGRRPEHLRGVLSDADTHNLAGHVRRNFAVLLKKSLAGNGCEQIRHLYVGQKQTGADRIPEPAWRAGLSIAHFCDDGQDAIHVISRDDQRYSAEVTIRKAEAIAGPYRCDKFEEIDAIRCAGCSHKGKLTSPIELGSGDPSTADTPATEESKRINELAALSLFEYDRIRTREAKSLGVRTSTLDDMVVKQRATNQKSEDMPFSQVEPWPEPVAPSAVLDEVAACIRRHIVCDEAVVIAATLWIAMTHFMDVIQVAPLAVITAPEKRCGKTQLLSLIGKLVCKGLPAANITAAALFRSIDLWHPTLLIDEADAFMRENEELRGVLNCGHTRDTAFCIRTVGDDHTPKQFNVWGAKAISGIGKLADTLMDRAIVLELRRKLQHETVERLRYTDDAHFATLRRKLARMSMDEAERVASARPSLPDGLHDRAQDNWEPMLAIADIAGGRWVVQARQAAQQISGEAEPVQSISTELLADIHEILTSRGADRISSFDLLQALCADDENRWASYNRGQPIKPRQLATRLKEFGIHSSSIRIGNATPKGYMAADFSDAFERYLAQVQKGAEPDHQEPITPLLPVAPAVAEGQPVAVASATDTRAFLDEVFGDVACGG